MTTSWAPIAVVDVHYEENVATAACLVAPDWSSATADEERVTRVEGIAPRQPGAFYERELPPVLQVLSLMRANFSTIVVDGYVELDEQGTPGLGAHLHDHFGGRYAVAGVAKTAYRGSHFAARVVRGTSVRPLFVTARGIPVAEAARLVDLARAQVARAARNGST